ncbi:hypothetical protein [Methylobacterium gossipiicola]|uniref:Uncharacterized protein n=1 Tax=Methylobacterium gossipiicola TaxID=582675 RepID=A0A1I2SZG6_9HYPH|nr:hypothetical protein [Methylobacterium gossipiicola]SFG58102.1 hypothetical protein SAMN05192565_10619 [Methylobacterium gossipiicola]
MRIPASRGTVLGAFADDVDGAGWTASWSDVTSWLMERAEARFGPRDPRWFFTGLEFADVEAPTTYYPANRPFHVGIRLTAAAAASPAEAYFQLAHEVVHLLGPSPTHAKANVLEEGVATVFQQETVAAVGLPATVSHPSYLAAAGKVACLEAFAQDAVRSVRALYPDLRDLTEDELGRIVPGLPAGLAGALCSPFRR